MADETLLTYDRSLRCALAYAGEGRVEEWVHLYLCSDGHNVPFSEGLKLASRVWRGPMNYPLASLRRICGPEKGMQWQVDADGFERHVGELMQAIEDECDLPPLIVHCTPEGMELNDGNHRHEAYRRLGRDTVSVIFWATAGEEEFLPPVS